MSRWAWAEVDLAALEHNVEVLRAAAASAEVWAVVKANAYGHGAAECATAAVRAGAAGLCVALVQEGVELREAGVGVPIFVLSEQPPEQAATLVGSGLTATVASVPAVDALVAGGANGLGVHMKVDTGMRRIGCAPDGAVALADAIAATDGAVVLEGVWTHLAVADEPSDPYNARQLDVFDRVVADLAAAGHRPPQIHAANSAGALAHPRARGTMVRTGIALYGISPGHGVDHLAGELRPVMSLRARVSFVKRVAAGDRISYGLRHTFAAPTTVATLPIGYADGVPRRLAAAGGEVLFGGHRCPIVGVVTMDQLMIDIGDAPVSVGDEAVLIGRQGDAQIRAEDWADLLGTIGYEITCAISRRVERHHRP